jgi:hypothetical protein
MSIRATHLNEPDGLAHPRGDVLGGRHHILERQLRLLVLVTHQDVQEQLKE